MTKKSKKSLPLILSATMLVSSMLPSGIGFAASTATVNVNIDTGAEKTLISPYIYGENFDDLSGADVTARRQGGNRMTGYNWENNASNAGSDYLNNSDNYMVSSLPASQQSIPGIATTNFVDSSISKGIPYSLVTLQMAGYAAKDMNGTVSAAEAAPSARWAEVKPAKGSAFSDKPDLTDNYVYMDEYVNYLVSKYGKASTNSGIKGYSLDNEPALWSSTHSRIHPDKVTCEELVNKSTALSSAVKNVDPSAEIFGPALYGYYAYLTLQDAPDWSKYKSSYDNVFVNYYLDQMKKQSDTSGKRLLDALDVHWYPEAQGAGIRICNENDGTSIECNKARIQAPRTLWDGTYKENSWLSGGSYLPLLPSLNTSISKYYPGTKLAFTEYYYGGSNHISGGIAEADVLGLFGKNNVYLATLWGSCSSSSYTVSGVNIYRNYDGKKSTYGDTSVKAVTSDNENSSVYSSYDSKDPSKLHIIMINKNYDNPTTVNFSITDSKKYTSGKAWGFDRSGSAITERAVVTGINNNTFSYTLPALSVYHIVLDSSGAAAIVGDVNGDGKINSTDSSLIKRYILQQTTTISSAADVNMDGKINSADYSIIKSYILKKITSLPYIVNQAPVASYTASKTSGFTDETIKFDASSSKDPDGNISYYSWNFGDGTEGNGVSISHKFKSSGAYDVKLSVADDKGTVNTTSQAITITSSTGDNAKYGFEDGTTNGFSFSSSTGAATTEKAFKGTGSVKWDLIPPAAGANAPDMSKTLETPLAPGTTVTCSLYIPSGADITEIMPYVMPHNSDWSTVKFYCDWKSYDSVKKDAWNEFSFILPADMDTTLIQQIGVQIKTTSKCTIYVDSIDWN